MARIKNINGTSDYNCKCGSWIDHWVKYSGQAKPSYCTEVSCTNSDLVGAHVQKAGSSDDSWYIVPLCNSHNASGNELVVSDTYKLVPANRGETCGY